MSQDATDAGIRRTLVDRLPSDVVFEEDPRFPEAGTYRGRADVLRYFSQFMAQFEEYRMTLEDLLGGDGDEVVACLRIQGRGKGSSAAFDIRPAWVFTVQRGQVVRIRGFYDRGEGLEAAGLRE